MCHENPSSFHGDFMAAGTNTSDSAKNGATLGFEATLWLAADTFSNNPSTGFVLANPPLNDSDWFRKDDDVRWQFGVPPKGNANFAWVQHFIHHLGPQGMVGKCPAVSEFPYPLAA
jgi:hypothetical protein